ncbi:uncharacterized protein LOC122082271 [Macadamia integrifolia]|uniref:uncharacterized protein LOC122082271 n=1 Tax=Macadamia integrifolia TaxID=60698 RepID=UPI001C4FB7CC|nr:uncharacterized protein LOC122082271 [Macadamia integrifolia]
MLNLFGRSWLPWGFGNSDKVELTTAELGSLRSEIADLEERKAHLKAQLEHLDELLRSARLAGYLFIRTRWKELPGEPPIIDSDIDDWLPRFVVLHGECIFFYLLSTDLSPQDSILLSDMVEVGPLPGFIQEDEQTRYSFYILTCHGLRYECSSISEIKANSWLKALCIDCKLGTENTEAVKDSSETSKQYLDKARQNDYLLTSCLNNTATNEETQRPRLHVDTYTGGSGPSYANVDSPWRCLCFGLDVHNTYTLPRRLTVLQNSQSFFTDDLTFMTKDQSSESRMNPRGGFKRHIDGFNMKNHYTRLRHISLFLENQISGGAVSRVSQASELQIEKMSSQIYKSAASKVLRSLISASKSAPVLAEGRAVAVATATSFRGKVPSFASFYGRENSQNESRGWVSGALALPAAVYMLQDQEAHAAEMERTFIAIKPDGVQRGLISEILSRFERKGFKLVAIKLVVPSKEFAQKHYHDLKERPFFNGLCDFLSSGPVLAMVWEGEGVIKYGRKLIGATDPQKSEPGTIRGDLAVVVGRNIIHGSDGPETAKDEINLWFKPEELVSFTSNEEKWVYGNN